MNVFVGLDLGQAQDYTAAAVLTRPPATSNPAYSIPYLRRWPLGTSYPAIVRDVVAMLNQPPLRRAVLVVDQTGVGRAVVDQFEEKIGGRIMFPVTITAGHDVTEDLGRLKIPKKELVGALQILLQGRRLKISRRLADAQVLARELEQFRVKITAAANETFGAWREGQHDDLVLAVAMAAWVAERRLPPTTWSASAAPRVIGGEPVRLQEW